MALDSDDALEPASLATTVPILLANPELGFVYTDYRRVEARRLAACGDEAGARRLWVEVAALKPWNLAARWRAR